MDLLAASDELFVLKRSPIYETAPVGGPPQGDFLNAAVLIASSLEARDIMSRLLEIEKQLGRERGEPNAPRTIDLDLLWIEGEVVDEPGLAVPHPRLVERAFALRPLLDVAPDACHPVSRQDYAALPAASEALRLYNAP